MSASVQPKKGPGLAVPPAPPLVVTPAATAVPARPPPALAPAPPRRLVLLNHDYLVLEAASGPRGGWGCCPRRRGHIDGHGGRRYRHRHRTGDDAGPPAAVLSHVHLQRLRLRLGGVRVPRRAPALPGAEAQHARRRQVVRRRCCRRGSQDEGRPAAQRRVQQVQEEQGAGDGAQHDADHDAGRRGGVEVAVGRGDEGVCRCWCGRGGCVLARVERRHLCWWPGGKGKKKRCEGRVFPASPHCLGKGEGRWRPFLTGSGGGGQGRGCWCQCIGVVFCFPTLRM